MLGIIAGSGLSTLADFDAREPLVLTTACGAPSAPLQRGMLRGSDIVFLPRHGVPHSIPPHMINYRANLLALRAAGVDRVLAVNAVGGITSAMVAGHLVLPHDLIDYTWGRAHTFSDGTDGSLLQHVDFTAPFAPDMRAALAGCLQRRGLSFSDRAVYAVAQGPRLETAAEINRYERDGCDIVGMTAMPEAALARELGLPYAMLCVVSNPAAGRPGAMLDEAAMACVLAEVMPAVRNVIADFCACG